MTTLTVYDPAMCCSTGICGPDIDPHLVQFAADLDWLAERGVEVKRINLSQEPVLFAENESVKAVLEKSGVEGLPVIMLGDTLQTSGQYPVREKLAKMTGVEFKAGATETASTSCCGGDAAESEKVSSSCC